MTTAFPVLLRSDHRILRSESCSGYVDIFGIWNTGFYCPQSESKSAVYCCGTETYKYCCTTKNSTAEEATELPISTVLVRTPVIVGIISGFIVILAFIILTTCLFCPCCFFYRKRTTHIPAGLYRMQCGTSSTTSALVNSLNSPFSGGTTPTENNNLWNHHEIFTTTMRPPSNYTSSSGCRNQINDDQANSNTILASNEFFLFPQNNNSQQQRPPPQTFTTFWNPNDLESFRRLNLNRGNTTTTNNNPGHHLNFRQILQASNYLQLQNGSATNNRSRPLPPVPSSSSNSGNGRPSTQNHNPNSRMPAENNGSTFRNNSSFSTLPLPSNSFASNGCLRGGRPKTLAPNHSNISSSHLALGMGSSSHPSVRRQEDSVTTTISSIPLSATHSSTTTTSTTPVTSLSSSLPNTSIPLGNQLDFPFRFSQASSNGIPSDSYQNMSRIVAALRMNDNAAISPRVVDVTNTTTTPKL